MNALILLFLTSVAPQPLGPPATYGDGFSDRYCVRVDRPPTFADEVQIEREIIIRSPAGRSSARIVRTAGSKVPYEEAEAHIFIENAFGDPIYLKTKGFRNIELRWIGERFLFIDKGIGHIVRIEEIFDLVEEKWLVQHTASYKW